MFRPGQATVTGSGIPSTNTLLVTGGILRALNVQPVLGRAFSRDDDQPGAAETAILSNGYWQRRFGGDPSVIGRTITVDGRPREVIGVMSARFTLREIPMDLILPMRLDMARASCGLLLQRTGEAEAGHHGGSPPMPMSTACCPSTSNDTCVLTFLKRTPSSSERPCAPSKKTSSATWARSLWVLLGSISILLLIACANVANLLLVRAETRATELALRTALGAGSGRLARGLMVESLTLSLIGGLIGVGLAYGGLRVLLAFPPANLPRLNEIAIDLPVLGFALGVSVLSGLLFGLVPIVRVAGQRLSNLAGAVRGGGRWASAGKNQYRSQNALVVVQVALALVMLVSSGLMIRTFQNLRSVDPGFTDPATVQTVRLSLPASMDPDTLMRTQAANSRAVGGDLRCHVGRLHGFAADGGRGWSRGRPGGRDVRNRGAPADANDRR